MIELISAAPTELSAVSTGLPGAGNAGQDGLNPFVGEGQNGFLKTLTGFIAQSRQPVLDTNGGTAVTSIQFSQTLQNLPGDGKLLPDVATLQSDELPDLSIAGAEVPPESVLPEASQILTPVITDQTALESTVDEENPALLAMMTPDVSTASKKVPASDEDIVLPGVRSDDTARPLPINPERQQLEQKVTANISQEQAHLTQTGTTQGTPVIVPATVQNSVSSLQKVISQNSQPSAQQVSSIGENQVGSLASANLPGTTVAPAERPLPSLQINAPLAQQGWADEVGDRIRWVVNNNFQGAELRINPQQLGPVEVRVTVQNDQIHLMFTSQHAPVREALDAAIPRLREMFGDNNMNLVNVDVSQHSFSQQRQASDDPQGSSDFAFQHNDSSALMNDDGQLVVEQRLQSLGTIDLFA